MDGIERELSRIFQGSDRTAFETLHLLPLPTPEMALRFLQGVPAGTPVDQLRSLAEKFRSQRFGGGISLPRE